MKIFPEFLYSTKSSYKETFSIKRIHVNGNGTRHLNIPENYVFKMISHRREVKLKIKRNKKIYNLYFSDLITLDVLAVVPCCLPF